MSLDLDLESLSSLLHEGQLNFCEAKPPYQSKVCQVYQSSNLQPHFIPFKCAKLPHVNLNKLRTTAFNSFGKLESSFKGSQDLFMLRGKQVYKLSKTQISSMRSGDQTQYWEQGYLISSLMT